MVPTAITAVAIAPVPIALGIDTALTAVARASPAHGHVAGGQASVSQTCFDNRLYEPLAALPPGVVLGEIDLGPHVLAHTNDSVLTAPYPRTESGILRGYAALGGPTALAEARLRALNVTYFLDCRLNPLRVSAAGFAGDLRRGKVPSWLEALSPPGAPMQIYRLRP